MNPVTGSAIVELRNAPILFKSPWIDCRHTETTLWSYDRGHGVSWVPKVLGYTLRWPFLSHLFLQTLPFHFGVKELKLLSFRLLSLRIYLLLPIYLFITSNILKKFKNEIEVFHFIDTTYIHTKNKHSLRYLFNVLS